MKGSISIKARLHILKSRRKSKTYKKDWEKLDISIMVLEWVLKE